MRRHAMFVLFCLSFTLVLLGNDQCIETESDLCACDDVDAWLAADDGCSEWPDAEECSGWHSVAEDSGEDPDSLFEDGTELCGYGCCIMIYCD